MSIVKEFLSIQQNVRLYHWTTTSYNQHIVSGELYEKLDNLIDKFIETFLGKLYKIEFDTMTITSTPLTQDTIITCLKKFKQFLMGELQLLLSNGKLKNNDLINIRDDILGEVNRFLFLLRLK